MAFARPLYGVGNFSSEIGNGMYHVSHIDYHLFRHQVQGQAPIIFYGFFNIRKEPHLRTCCE